MILFSECEIIIDSESLLSYDIILKIDYNIAQYLNDTGLIHTNLYQLNHKELQVQYNLYVLRRI